MPDVVLPALNEASAVAWVLGRMPDGFRPIVVDNGSTDVTAALAAARGATVVSEPRRGFGQACWAGLQAATSDIVCFMDCDASLDPVALPLLAGYVERDEADLVLGQRIARRGSWPVHARLANRVLAAEVRRRTRLALPDLGPMRVASRTRPGVARDRRPSFGVATGDGAAGGTRRLAPPHRARRVRRTDRAFEGHRDGRRHVAGRVRHGPTAARHAAVHLTIITKAPERGRVKTRLCPPCTPAEAAAVAAAALADTIDAVDDSVADTPRRWANDETIRRVLLLDGPPGEWVPPGYDVVAQRGSDLGERLAHGFDELGPGVVVGMDTPAAGRWLGGALDAVAHGLDAIGLATDGGYWVIGLARCDDAVFAGVPMSESHTGLAQLRRLHDLGRRVRLLPMARDLDDLADLIAIAAATDGGRLPSTARAMVARLRADGLV